ncbi:MAG TPA: Lrp/AsnC family transcriptional regulator [Planctomycetota bacterium]|jgi:Lrp/AsnC family transcriptional regulator for asnA, asnC and gidA|nr:Lrp/AsnC family transcriptional regulator [Planctomycetota bacterium]OQC21814.1 MAG: Leucine-responsive regulatory protein [Planctomycetes bacterium ADurb.Bin069]NMD36964.1 Lrp/AsnC family transcriptional regulator [Planctomycetota bacterium]HNR98235.1 Lrp/AsnC family transcriptional regulator [Planctomycetota bacterium]HNU24896.1 Lrp/AsnC family transcriptional regulator [Planctomycetota bacterium]
MDRIDFAIIRELFKDGRRSFKKIADRLGLAQNTVRNRYDKLTADGTLQVCGLVDPDKIENHRLVYMGIKLAGMGLVEKAKDFAKLPGVINVCVVTGRYDLLLTVLLKEDTGLLTFFKEHLYKIKGILSTETFVSYKGYNHRVPYVLP